MKSMNLLSLIFNTQASGTITFTFTSCNTTCSNDALAILSNMALAGYLMWTLATFLFPFSVSRLSWIINTSWSCRWWRRTPALGSSWSRHERIVPCGAAETVGATRPTAAREFERPIGTHRTGDQNRASGASLVRCNYHRVAQHIDSWCSHCTCRRLRSGRRSALVAEMKFIRTCLDLDSSVFFSLVELSSI